MSFKDYLILFLGTLSLGLLFWLYIEIQPNEYTETVEEDSTTTVERDTTYPDTTSRIIIPEISLPDTVYSDTTVETKTDTFKTQPDSIKNSSFTKIRNYSTTVSDTLINGTIETTVQGYLVSQKLNYTPRFPLKITVSRFTTVNRTVTKTEKPKPYPSFGVQTSTDFKELKGIEVTGSWTTSNGNRITYGYNPSIKTHTIQLSYNLRNIFK